MYCAFTTVVRMMLWIESVLFLDTFASSFDVRIVSGVCGYTYTCRCAHQGARERLHAGNLPPEKYVRYVQHVKKKVVPKRVLFVPGNVG